MKKHQHNYQPVDEDSDTGDGNAPEVPEFSFDGFTVELNEKVTLTPVGSEIKKVKA